MKEVTNFYDQFLHYLSIEDKQNAVHFMLDLLHTEKISLTELYQDYLTRSLNEFICPVENREECIWKEHTRTAIVRTIVESTYLDLAKEKSKQKRLNKSVIVVCPSEEYHEVGALIVSNFFELAGFDSRYIGANTPKSDILSAVKTLKPDYLALSVTNYYNIIQTKKITEECKLMYPNVKIIVGGNAFYHPSSIDSVQFDFHLQNYQDIESLAKGLRV